MKCPSQTALYGIEQRFERDVSTVVLDLRDEGALFVDSIGQLRLCPLFLFLRSPDFQTGSQRIEVTLDAGSFGRSCFAVLFRLDPV